MEIKHDAVACCFEDSVAVVGCASTIFTEEFLVEVFNNNNIINKNIGANILLRRSGACRTILIRNSQQCVSVSVCALAKWLLV